jgi:UDP-N-acetyl-2-amino-2-deoxyglucuronate dehydrogenase
MIHIGIIGGGGISDTHARATQQVEGTNIVSFFGTNQDKITQLSKTYGGRAYSEFDAFLNHKPMDAVIIGSPSGLHAAQGIQCARRGLHVLVEKPIDVSVEKTDELIAASEKARVKLAVCFQDRFANDSIRLKQLIESGGLGKIILVSASAKWYRSPEYYNNSRWRGKLALDGGGALINQGVHTVDLLLWLLGEVTRVYAKSLTALHDIESEDTLVSTLEFTNGAIGTIEAATSAFPGYDRRIEITGSEGTIVLEHDRIIRADLKKPSVLALESQPQDTNRSSSSPIVTDVTGHKRILEDFLEAIQKDGQPRCDGYEGRRSVRLVEAIYRSAKMGQPIILGAQASPPAGLNSHSL